MKNPLRVMMLSFHTCPLATLGGKDSGGMNVYVKELTRQLGRMDIHVDVFTRSQDEHVPHIIHDLGYGNRVVHIPAGPETPLPKNELSTYIPEFVERITTFVEEKGIHYDVIHSHYWMSGIAAKQFKEMWEIPVVQMFHTLALLKNMIATEGEFEGEYRINGELEAMKAADKIIAATPAEQNQLKGLYEVDERKIKIIPPGVDTCHFYPIPKDEARDYIGSQNKKCMILFVGRIEPLKGIDTLIRAIALMRDNGDIINGDICLAIIGGDASACENKMSAEMARLRKLREELGLEDMVTFLGKRDQEQLPYYYSAANIVVVPSQYESFGMVALEAMACGTPVVASEVGGLAYLVKDGVTGFHVPNRDPEALAEKLGILICDPELREKLGHQAYEYARDYSWQYVARNVNKVYQSIID
ncbi:MAG: glycosyltransferase [Anaerolineales bacterium]|nr:glycosyltransferase [Anaerolineales bacterium]